MKWALFFISSIALTSSLYNYFSIIEKRSILKKEVSYGSGSLGLSSSLVSHGKSSPDSSSLKNSVKTVAFNITEKRSVNRSIVRQKDINDKKFDNKKHKEIEKKRVVGRKDYYRLLMKAIDREVEMVVINNFTHKKVKVLADGEDIFRNLKKQIKRGVSYSSVKEKFRKHFFEYLSKNSFIDFDEYQSKTDIDLIDFDNFRDFGSLKEGFVFYSKRFRDDH